MIREQLKARRSVSELGFRFRGLESTRLEALTDTVFGFSITLLVISVSVPDSYLELQVSMYGFIGFIFCTMLLFGIWNGHYRYFTYYGLEDRTNRSLNFIFLFILLFYVYPLKYLFNILGTTFLIVLLKTFNITTDALTLKQQELQDSYLTTDQWADLMIRFGIGFLLINLIFFLWYFRAYRQKEALLLNSQEISITKFYFRRYLLMASVPLLSMVIVLIFGGEAAGWAGFIYLGNLCIVFLDKWFKKRLMRSNSLTS